MKKYAKLLGLILAFAMAFSLMAAGSAFAADDAHGCHQPGLRSL